MLRTNRLGLPHFVSVRKVYLDKYHHRLSVSF